MSILVLSVPHTGTRFTCKFLDKIRVNYRQYHAEPASFEDLQFESGKVIIPLRDPILQFLSTYLRNGLYNDKKTLEISVACWELLGELEDQFDIEYLRLDGNLQDEMARVAGHCGVDLTEEYDTSPVGNQYDEPVGYDLWDKFRVDGAEEALKPYRDKYGY